MVSRPVRSAVPEAAGFAVSASASRSVRSVVVEAAGFAVSVLASRSVGWRSQKRRSDGLGAFGVSISNLMILKN